MGALCLLSLLWFAAPAGKLHPRPPLSCLLAFSATPAQLPAMPNSPSLLCINLCSSHGRPYNKIKNWDYVSLVEAMHNGEGALYAVRVSKVAAWFAATCLSAAAAPLAAECLAPARLGATSGSHSDANLVMRMSSMGEDPPAGAYGSRAG